MMEGMVKKEVRIYYLIVFSNSSTIFIQVLLGYKYVHASPKGHIFCCFLSF